MRDRHQVLWNSTVERCRILRSSLSSVGLPLDLLGCVGRLHYSWLMIRVAAGHIVGQVAARGDWLRDWPVAKLLVAHSAHRVRSVQVVELHSRRSILAFIGLVDQFGASWRRRRYR